MIYILLYLAGYYKVLAFFIKIQYTVNPTLKHQTYKVWYNKMGGVEDEPV